MESEINRNLAALPNLDATDLFTAAISAYEVEGKGLTITQMIEYRKKHGIPRKDVKENHIAGFRKASIAHLNLSEIVYEELTEHRVKTTVITKAVKNLQRDFGDLIIDESKQALMVPSLKDEGRWIYATPDFGVITPKSAGDLIDAEFEGTTFLDFANLKIPNGYLPSYGVPKYDASVTSLITIRLKYHASRVKVIDEPELLEEEERALEQWVLTWEEAADILNNNFIGCSGIDGQMGRLRAVLERHALVDSRSFINKYALESGSYIFEAYTRLRDAFSPVQTLSDDMRRFLFCTPQISLIDTIWRLRGGKPLVKYQGNSAAGPIFNKKHYEVFIDELVASEMTLVSFSKQNWRDWFQPLARGYALAKVVPKPEVYSNAKRGVKERNIMATNTFFYQPLTAMLNMYNQLVTQRFDEKTRTMVLSKFSAAGGSIEKLRNQVYQAFNQTSKHYIDNGYYNTSDPRKRSSKFLFFVYSDNIYATRHILHMGPNGFEYSTYEFWSMDGSTMEASHTGLFALMEGITLINYFNPFFIAKEDKFTEVTNQFLISVNQLRIQTPDPSDQKVLDLIHKFAAGYDLVIREHVEGLIVSLENDFKNSGVELLDGQLQFTEDEYEMLKAAAESRKFRPSLIQKYTKLYNFYLPRDVTNGLRSPAYSVKSVARSLGDKTLGAISEGWIRYVLVAFLSSVNTCGMIGALRIKIPGLGSGTAPTYHLNTMLMCSVAHNLNRIQNGMADRGESFPDIVESKDKDFELPVWMDEAALELGVKLTGELRVGGGSCFLNPVLDEVIETYESDLLGYDVTYLNYSLDTTDITDYRPLMTLNRERLMKAMLFSKNVFKDFNADNPVDIDYVKQFLNLVKFRQLYMMGAWAHTDLADLCLSNCRISIAALGTVPDYMESVEWYEHAADMINTIVGNERTITVITGKALAQQLALQPIPDLEQVITVAGDDNDLRLLYSVNEDFDAELTQTLEEKNELEEEIPDLDDYDELLGIDPAQIKQTVSNNASKGYSTFTTRLKNYVVTPEDKAVYFSSINEMYNSYAEITELNVIIVSQSQMTIFERGLTFRTLKPPFQALLIRQTIANRLRLKREIVDKFWVSNFRKLSNLPFKVINDRFFITTILSDATLDRDILSDRIAEQNEIFSERAAAYLKSAKPWLGQTRVKTQHERMVAMRAQTKKSAKDRKRDKRMNRSERKLFNIKKARDKKALGASSFFEGD